MLPDFIPNPQRLFEFFNGIEFNIGIEMYSFESPSFLYNFMDELSTWLLLLLFYILIRLLVKLRPSSRLLLGWKSNYEYNAVIRTLIETYLSLFFCSLLDLWFVYLTSKR
eukprot:TRINITY_DN15270_c0_g1_i7.p2 TRINITY_DN15270_c0_g1~~TRINITY_DN15270_c0_g1_i7.p2  ORF type:complete len:110 (+),score=21.17 TRINITY_DN15270_c0_g1_i7:177-506(+)